MRKMVLTALAATLLGGAAQAADIFQLTILDPSRTLTSAGGTLNFDATVAAPGSNSGNLFLNGFGFSASTPLSVDVSPSLDNFPFFLAAGSSYTDLAFIVKVAANSAPGTYVGFFYVQGGADENAQDTRAEQSFSVTINASAAPEPASWAMMIAGFGLVGAALRRRHVKIGFA